jgi:hypothetical protein
MSDRTLRVLTGTLMPIGEFDPVVTNRSAEFLLRQCARLPDWMAWQLSLATFMFGWGSLLVFARPFPTLTPDQRTAYVAMWARSFITPLRDYIRLVHSLILLAANENRNQIG